MKHVMEKNGEKRVTPHVHFPLEGMTATTIFINHTLRIEWMKVDDGDRLSRAIANEWSDGSSETVFDILLRASLQELFFNWQPLFSFVYRFLKATTPNEIFCRLAPTLSIGMGEMADGGKPALSLRKVGQIESFPLQLEDDNGLMQKIRMYGVVLCEGTLFVLNKETKKNAHGERSIRKVSVAAEKEAKKDTGKTPFSVLSARLDSSRNIVETLLPEAYYNLITQIWDESDGVLVSRGGYRAKRSGTELQYMIPRNTETDPAYDAIQCAIEMRHKMRTIETRLKADGGWFTRIRLNIGISSGRDCLNADDPTSSMAFMLPGGAADQAYYLSTIAQKGGIWITKTAFSHIAPHLRSNITFGLYRNNKLVPNIFAKVSGLRNTGDTQLSAREIQSISVTRIINVKENNGDGV